jgi:Fe-S cluster assembly protein SufB
MTTATSTIEELANQEYKYGFFTDIEMETVPRGLNEDVIRLISAKKQEPAWLLDWRLKAYRHWLTLTEPTWAKVHYPPIDYQAPSRGSSSTAWTKSIPNCGRPLRSSASRSTSRSG